MSGEKFVRIPVFLSPSVLKRIDGLVLETSANRSKVLRQAVDRGLPAATRDIRRQYRERRQRAGVMPLPLPSASGSFPRLSFEEAVRALRAFGDTVWNGGARFSQEVLRDLLHAYAQTLDLDPDDFDDAVAQSLALVLSGGDDDAAVPPRDPNLPPD